MKQKDILIILILIFVFVAAWIGFNIYHSMVRSTIPKTTNEDISFITPNFDTKTIDKLRERQKVNPSFEIEDIKPTPTPVLPAEIETLQKASGSGTLQI